MLNNSKKNISLIPNPKGWQVCVFCIRRYIGWLEVMSNYLFQELDGSAITIDYCSLELYSRVLFGTSREYSLTNDYKHRAISLVSGQEHRASPRNKLLIGIWNGG